MNRDRRTFGAAALLTGLLCASPAIAEDVKPDDIATKMGGVVDSLGKKQTGQPVQGEQKAIVHDLDELIAQLEKQCRAVPQRHQAEQTHARHGRLEDQQRTRAESATSSTPTTAARAGASSPTANAIASSSP